MFYRYLCETNIPLYISYAIHFASTLNNLFTITIKITTYHVTLHTAIFKIHTLTEQHWSSLILLFNLRIKNRFVSRIGRSSYPSLSITSSPFTLKKVSTTCVKEYNGNSIYHSKFISTSNVRKLLLNTKGRGAHISSCIYTYSVCHLLFLTLNRQTWLFKHYVFFYE